MNRLALIALVDEFAKLGSVDQMRLHPKSTIPTPRAAPPAPAFQVKHAFGQSEFSGVMGFGPFPQASMIPAWREAPLRKQSGPPGDDPARLEATGDLPVPNGRPQMRKEALSPMALRMLAGTGVGALGGAAAGSMGAGQGHRLRGALEGAALGGAAGTAVGYAAPRMQTAMRGGMTLGQAAREVGADAKAHLTSALGSRTPTPVSPAAPVAPRLNIPEGQSLTRVQGAEHAAAYQKIDPMVRGALENSDLVRAGVPPHMARQLAEMSRQPGESKRVALLRHAAGGGEKAAIQPAAQSMATNPGFRAQPTVAPALKVANVLTPAGQLRHSQNSASTPRLSAPGPSIAQQSKPRGFGTPLPGLTKQALLERLVRLGATPIPGTPRLLMKNRSPAELGALQHGVEQAWNQRVTNPLLRAAEPVLSRLPNKVQGLARKGAETMARDPVGTVVTHALPLPGAFPGYVAAKKGLERVIDRIAPV